ncbi:MAG: hypothetical protein ABSB65_14035 [Candidatus Acidiferrales bacterium]|jgi:hypothetical protein
MPLADKFARILCKQLNQLLPSCDWRCNGRIGHGREAVDVYGKMTDKPIYIEVELRRDEPLTNVVKLWRAIEKDSHTKEVILIHAFSGNYPQSDTHRLNAMFIGEKMQHSCGATYVPLDFPYRPRKGATVVGDYRRRAAKSLASLIRERLTGVLIP